MLNIVMNLPTKLVVVALADLGSFSIGYHLCFQAVLHRSDSDEPAKMSFYRHLSAMPDHDAM